MTSAFVVFKGGAGVRALTSVGVCDSELVSEQALPGEQSIQVPSAEGASIATHYFDPVNGLSAKTGLPLSLGKAQITADGDDTATITGVPLDVDVIWPDGMVTSGDDTVEFAVDLPGTYAFRFRGVKYLDKEVTIEAVAAA